MTGPGEESLSARCGHAGCLLCGEDNPWSVGLRFRATDDGAVVAEFAGHPGLQGYEGLLHGGVIAALLDAAMTHCLFHHGVVGLTGELSVRYLHPVRCEANLTVRAWIASPRSPHSRLRPDIPLAGLGAPRPAASFRAGGVAAQAPAAAGEG